LFLVLGEIKPARKGILALFKRGEKSQASFFRHILRIVRTAGGHYLNPGQEFSSLDEISHQ